MNVNIMIEELVFLFRLMKDITIQVESIEISDAFGNKIVVA
ncbi:MAG: hypothetical protein ACK4M4_05665 [Flavobacterium sp.]